MSCSIIYPLPSSKKSSPYLKCQLHVLISSYETLKSFLGKEIAVHVEQNHRQTASVSTPLPTYTIAVSSWTSLILTVCSIYKLLLDFLSRKSLPVSLAICINLVHLDCQMPSAGLWNKHTILHPCPQFIVVSLSASFCPSISEPISSTCILRFLSFLPLSILTTNFAVCVRKLSVRLSLHFFAFVFFYNHCNTGPLSVSSMLLSSPVTILRQLSPLHTAKYKGNYRMYLPRVQFRVLVFCSIRLITEI